MILEFRHHLHIISKNMRCLKIKTQDDNCEQATKNKHHSKPIYFDLMILLPKKKIVFISLVNSKIINARNGFNFDQ